MKPTDRFEASLTEEGRYRLLVESVTDYAIYMLDETGHVTSWNAGAQRFKGYAAYEILGQHFSRFYTPEDRESALPSRALDTAAKVGRFENEGWRLRKDGTRFWAHVIIDRIVDTEGRLVGFAKVTRDLTERREAQVALERTKEALIQAQKMEAIGQLTGGIAHDFNNLLAAVLGSLHLLRKRVPDDLRAQALIDNAVQGAERGAALTKRMLAFARRQELVPQPLDIPALVTGMSDLLQRSIGPQISIETRFPIALDRAMADGHQLELALLNLVVNARDAMPDGGTVVIGAEEADVDADHPANLEPGTYIRLSVADTGSGMDAETLARASEPFFTTKGVGKGTGLGLSMVHGLAEQSGGRLVLKSRLGEGTTAELWLPVADRLAEVLPEAPASTVTQGEPSARARKILVVDDDSLVLANTAMMLEDLGHRVLQATSGKRALTILNAGEQVDLVITDHAMPQMTGSQLAAEIHAEWPDMPILLATGYADLPPDGDGKLAKLTKPFTQVDLESAVAREFKNRPS